MPTWDDVIDERRSLLATFEALDDAQWNVQSLCGAWTVRQVLGHLVVVADPRLRHFLGPVARASGNFDKANDRLARAEAERPIPELLERYRERHTYRFRPPGFPLVAPLGDAMLHGLDVRVPLGLPIDRPVERWVPVLDLVFSRRATRGFGGSGRPSLTWVATDIDYRHGSGPEVRGAAADVAAAACGRGARVEHLEGPGQAALAAWLQR